MLTFCLQDFVLHRECLFIAEYLKNWVYNPNKFAKENLLRLTFYA